MERREKGFTLVEMVVALMAAVMLVGGVLVVYITSIQSWKEGSANVALERAAGIVMEKIVRGGNGRFGLREADIGTVQVSADGGSVTYLVDRNDPPTPYYNDDVTSRYYQLGTRIWYDPNSSVAGDEVALNRFGDVESVNFSLSSQVLTVKLALVAKAPLTTSRRLSVRMETNIFLRKRK
jgi:type II secretory pathway pseudopilin PulG